MLSELASDGRQLYVNGIPDLQIQHEPLAEPEKWPEVVPDGSVIIIDEVQRVWRPRGPGQKVPDHVAMLETHRHRGLDFYIITQGPNLVDSNVRALVGRHVHLRDLGILGRWWYEWPECADNCRTSWKNAPIKKRYRLPKRIFGQYKSASIHVKPVRSVPWMLAVMVVALLTVGGMSWVAYNAITDRMNPGGKLAAQQPEKPGVGGSPVQQVTGPSAPPEPSFIDDRIAFIPRISSRPETAPAYDSLRVVVNMPQVAGAVCFKGACKCLTQQATDAGLSPEECADWMRNPTFDHYRKPEAAQPSRVPAGDPSANTAAAAGGQVVPMASSSVNARVADRESSGTTQPAYLQALATRNSQVRSTIN
ncbi:zonular occludens toxin domain-containing protein [Comamonas endophytica]|nr:zonular occludens toxin domain-containing protein [Acidovorax sp. D4N7]